MDKGKALVPRNMYTQAVLKELGAVPYDPKVHNRMTNPYTGTRITCEEDYLAYVREYVYYRLCDEILCARYEERLRLQTNQMELHHAEEVRKTAEMRETHRRSLAKQKRRWICSVLALSAALAVFALWYSPLRADSAYAAGKAASYETGEDASYQNGYSAGTANGYSDGYFEGFEAGQDSVPSSGSVTVPRLGVSATTIVYVSRSGHLIHLRSDCSGMQYYTEMTYAAACAAGYGHCSKCF